MLRFNRSRAFRRAWGVGLRALGQGTPTNMAWDLGCRALGEGAFSENMVATSLRNCPKMAPKLLQNSSQMAPKLALEASWRALGGLLELLKRLGRPRGDFQGLMGRSWKPLGSLLGPKKEVLNGSWPLQEEFQERFQPSWGPKGSRKGGQEGPKSSPKGNSS